MNLLRIFNKAAPEAAPGVAPVGSGTLARSAESMNRWREQFNPLRGLTVAMVVQYLEEEMRGVFANLQWAYRYVEMTDADLLALVERRQSALLEMDWNVKIVEGSENDPAAAAQAEALTAAYERFQNLYDLVAHLQLATFRGFAAGQPVNAEGQLSWTQAVRWALLDQWNFARDGQFGAWYWNPSAQPVAGGQPGSAQAVELSDIVLRTHARPVDRIGLVKFVRATASEKNWDGFVEVFGIEQPVVIGPTNVPEGKEDAYKTAAQNIADGGGGYLPNGSEVVYPNGQRGDAPFKARLDHLSEKLILAGTGGMLTMLAESGSGTLAGGAHADTFATLARGEARRISEILQRQFDARFLAAMFPGQPVLAYFELAANEEQDSGQVVDHASKLSAAGYLIEPGEIEQRTGYKVTRAPSAPALPGFVPNKAEPGTADLSTLAAAQHAALAPVAKELQAILADAAKADADPVAIANRLLALRDGLPAELRRMASEDKTTLALEQLAAAAFRQGIEEAATQPGAAS